MPISMSRPEVAPPRTPMIHGLSKTWEVGTKIKIWVEVGRFVLTRSKSSVISVYTGHTLAVYTVHTL